MEERITIDFTMKISPIRPINEEMTLCRCYVMALGKNHNKSDIPKEAADDALPTLFNIPVVGHLYADENGEYRMGGHDVHLEQTEDGKYIFKSLTVPYGVVPEQSNPHYEEVEEKDGSIGTYLVSDVILWTGRYPELFGAGCNEEICFNQSMEIKPLETEKESDGYIKVLKYRYSALCLLGRNDDPEKNVVPCFPSARVEAYKFTSAEVWDKLFDEFKEKICSYAAINKDREGEVKSVNIEMILKEFGVEKAENLPFEITDGMTEDELRAKLQEVYAKDNKSSNQIETQKKKFEFEMTSEETRKALKDAVNSMCEWDENYYRNYWVCDFDSQYVYVGYYFAQEEGADGGYARFKYTKFANEIRLDKESFEKVRLVWITEEEAERLDKERAEYAALAEYKKAREESDKKQAYAAVLSEFTDLSEIEEYKTVMGNAMDFESVDALREKLYAIRGKTGKFKDNRSLDNVRIPVGFSKTDQQPDEVQEFFKRYLPEAVKDKN